MNERKNRFLMNVLMLVTVLTLFCGCDSSNVTQNPVSQDTEPNVSSSKALSDTELFASEYPSVSNDNIFISITPDEINNIFEQGTGIIFFGFPECKWCQEYVPMLQKIAQANGINKIYYYNIKADRTNNTDFYKQLVQHTQNYLNLDKNNNARICVPDVYFIKQGVIIGHNNDTSAIEGDVDPKAYWTVVQKAILTNKLNHYFEVLQATNDCDGCR